MADPNSDGWIAGALAAVAGAFMSLVWWVLKRGADREDKEREGREAWVKPLAELPGKLEALGVELEEMKRRIDVVEKDMRDLRAMLDHRDRRAAT